MGISAVISAQIVNT